MNKFKVGQFVRLLDPLGAAGAIQNKVYRISAIHPETDSGKFIMYLLHISEGKSHVYYDGTNPGWWYLPRQLQLVKGQLLFDFMYKEV